MNLFTKSLAAAALFAASVVAAQAAPETFALSWSGAAFENGATATGQITLDTTFLDNPSSGQESLSVPGAQVLSLTVTVSGASSGNGTFGTADFGSIYWNTAGGTLNLNTELVGQTTGGAPWGTTHDSSSGDFNVFSNFTTDAPYGTDYFQLTTNNGEGDTMNLTSMAPISAPDGGMTLALLGLAVGGIAVVQRKLKTA